MRLDQVAKIVKDAGPARIQRTNRQRVVSVNGSVNGRSLGDVARDVRAATDKIPLPEGYQLKFAGQVQQLEMAFTTLLSALWPLGHPGLHADGRALRVLADAVRDHVQPAGRAGRRVPRAVPDRATRSTSSR